MVRRAVRARLRAILASVGVVALTGTARADIVFRPLHEPLLYVATGLSGISQPIDVFKLYGTPVGQPIRTDQANTFISAFAVGPDGNRLYVARTCMSSPCDGSSVSVVDTASHEVIAVVFEPTDLGSQAYEAGRGTLTAIVVSPGGDRVYVSDANNGVIFAIDTASNTVVAPVVNLSWGPEGIAADPEQLIMSPDGTRLYAGDDTEGLFVWEINTTSNTLEGAISFYPGACSLAVAISPDGSRLYISDDDGFIWVADTATGKALASLHVGDANTAPSALALTPDGSRLFALTDVVLAIDTASNEIVNAAPIAYPIAIAADPTGDRAYVTSLCDGGSGCPYVSSFLTWDYTLSDKVYLPTTALGPIAIAPGPVCPGDCNGDLSVTIDKLMAGVTIVLGDATVAYCAAFDSDNSGTVTIDDLIRAVNAALTGCRAE